jgi:hypothetical protein
VVVCFCRGCQKRQVELSKALRSTCIWTSSCVNEFHTHFIHWIASYKFPSTLAAPQSIRPATLASAPLSSIGLLPSCSLAFLLTSSLPRHALTWTAALALLQKKMNDALMGILRVSDLESPPYISTQPWVYVHQVTAEDRFVILSSDGLNDFFTNQEAVHEVCRFMQDTPEGDPAKHLLEQLLTRAASNAGKAGTRKGERAGVCGGYAFCCEPPSLHCPQFGMSAGRYRLQSCWGLINPSHNADAQFQ